VIIPVIRRVGEFPHATPQKAIQDTTRRMGGEIQAVMHPHF
jgi:hypothetical protein